MAWYLNVYWLPVKQTSLDGVAVLYTSQTFERSRALDLDEVKSEYHRLPIEVIFINILFHKKQRYPMEMVHFSIKDKLIKRPAISTKICKMHICIYALQGFKVFYYIFHILFKLVLSGIRRKHIARFKFWLSFNLNTCQYKVNLVNIDWYIAPPKCGSSNSLICAVTSFVSHALSMISNMTYPLKYFINLRDKSS